MGVLAIILFKIGLSLGWVYLFMGIAIGGAVAPIYSALVWSKATAAGAIIAQAEEARETHRPAPRAPVRKKAAAARAEPADAGWEEF